MTQLFDLYVYGAAGEFVGVDPEYTAEAAIYAAQEWLAGDGFIVDIVEAGTGHVVRDRLTNRTTSL